MTRQIFQLKITLAEVTPAVWRRIALPGGYTLDRVHRAIQLSMGWRDYHLHSFEIDGVQYGQPDPEGELELCDELESRLESVAGKDAVFSYTYDFGDWWEHEISVEEIYPAVPGERYPICLDGARACPPEDVGGAYGYAGFLEALTQPGHPEHQAMRDWVGHSFDPAAFDPERVTTLLRRMS